MPEDKIIELGNLISEWAKDFGFAATGISNLALDDYLALLDDWLAKGYHGDMAWMQDRRNLRALPADLVPDTVRVISLRMDYLEANTQPLKVLNDKEKAYISRYALGRDYHKLMRSRLAKLSAKISEWVIENVPDKAPSQRAFVDSAPVLEKPFAEKSGLGWIGKNTLVLNRDAGSWFFLGEIYTSLELPIESQTANDQCGSCSACLSVCPTNAFPKPYVLDARKCISYLTIEHQGSIPEELRAPMGNRVFGCDDCQLVCPWNRFAKHSNESDFSPRHGLDSASLAELFRWDENDFLSRTAGSPIRRIGYERWQRNLAVGLGNGPRTTETVAALEDFNLDSSLVQEHVNWALKRLKSDVRNPTPEKILRFSDKTQDTDV